MDRNVEMPTASTSTIMEREIFLECIRSINPTTLPTFADGDKISALDFLRRFNQWMIPMTGMTSRMKAQYFGSCFLPLSAAESWYAALSDHDRSDIEIVISRFRQRFASYPEHPNLTEIVARIVGGNNAQDRPTSSVPGLASAVVPRVCVASAAVSRATQLQSLIRHVNPSQISTFPPR
jgi:hypothetical protein